MHELLAKVLFVDGDPGIHDQMRLLLENEPWDCRFVTTAAEALQVLRGEPCDLIVCAVEMPEQDGIELASRVRQDYPGIVRIFLSKRSGQTGVVQALEQGYAQQIIPKPWVDQEVREILRSALRQRAQQKKHSLDFQRLINTLPLLPALPESYSNVRSCIDGDEVDIEKMADYISQDVAISSALLHWANSALFGQRFQVDTIKKAIIVLGTDIVESLILSESVNRALAATPVAIPGFNFSHFKKHSMATAIISRLLIRSLHVDDLVKHDRAFIAGLLHDMGKLAAVKFFPERFARALELADSSGSTLIEAEQAVYGTQHAEVGAFLAEWWALPPFIVNAICWHHQPQTTPIEQDVICAAHLANLLSRKFGHGAGTDTQEPVIDADCAGRFFLTDEALEILQAETEKTLQGLPG